MIAEQCELQSIADLGVRLLLSQPDIFPSLQEVALSSHRFMRCRLAEVRELHFDDPRKQAEFERWDLSALAEELRETRAACEAAASPVVCSHNDLLSGNIMVQREVRSLEPPLTICDYALYPARPRHHCPHVPTHTAANRMLSADKIALGRGTIANGLRHDRSSMGALHYPPCTWFACTQMRCWHLHSAPRA